MTDPVDGNWSDVADDDPITTAREDGRTALTENEAKRLLAERGIAVPDGEVVRSVDEAVEAAERIGYPIVAKVASPSVRHKSDWAGGAGVAVGLTAVEEVREATERILDAANARDVDAGVHIEAAADLDAGVEVIVGGTRDPSFGPTVLVGLGGVVVEVLQDTSHRLAPVSTAEALEMTHELDASPLLDGYRGGPTVDRTAVAETVRTVGDLLTERETIREIEINPLLARTDGALALDALVVLEDGT